MVVSTYPLTWSFHEQGENCATADSHRKPGSEWNYRKAQSDFVRSRPFNAVSKEARRRILELKHWKWPFVFLIWTRLAASQSGLSPIKIMFDRNPNVRHVLVFGSRGWCKVGEASSSKLGPQLCKAILIDILVVQQGTNFEILTREKWLYLTMSNSMSLMKPEKHQFFR